jgi:hypothetical protein
MSDGFQFAALAVGKGWRVSLGMTYPFAFAKLHGSNCPWQFRLAFLVLRNVLCSENNLCGILLIWSASRRRHVSLGLERHTRFEGTSPSSQRDRLHDISSVYSLFFDCWLSSVCDRLSKEAQVGARSSVGLPDLLANRLARRIAFAKSLGVLSVCNGVFFMVQSRNTCTYSVRCVDEQRSFDEQQAQQLRPGFRND